VVAGEELLGFGAALLGGGTATLVAPVLPVPDAATVLVMRAYHDGLRSGRSPAQALAAVQADLWAEHLDVRDLETDDLVRWAASAAFVCLGAG
jgi:CHAT domain-containing protein